MAKKSRKPLPRKPKNKAKPKAKAVKSTAVKRTKRAAAPRKKPARRKKAAKPESKFEKIENAILLGVAQTDDLAVSLGLLAAARPPEPRKKRGK